MQCALVPRARRRRRPAPLEVAAEAVAAKASVQVPRPEAPASARSDLSSAREPKLCLSQVAKTHAAEMAELKRRLAELERGAQ